jgi:hypothetical protein
VRFYTVDIDDPLNAAAVAREGAGADPPHLSIYVGSTQRYNTVGRPEPPRVEQRIDEQIEYASKSGAARGFWKGLKWGAGIGGGIGLAVGVGLAFAGVLTGGLGLLALAGLVVGGAVGGGILGLTAGSIIGALTDKRKRAASARVGFNEAESLIRRRFGHYLPGGGGPLHNARFRPVTQKELQMFFKCRHDKDASGDSSMVGWTDTGPAPPNKIDSPDDEPVCENGQKLEHATPDRPVIYYARDDRNLTVLIHEGMHAYAHPNFTAQVRNYINEGAAEYLAHQLEDEIGTHSATGYGENVERVRSLVAVIGEEALRIAFFKGDFSAANRILGPCGFERWAQLLTANLGQSQEAEEMLTARGKDYCKRIETFPTGLEK